MGSVKTVADLDDWSTVGVAGLTDYIQTLLETDRHLTSLWVVGEVSSARQHSSGCFFTLQEPDGSAAISAVVWRSQLPKLAAVPAVGSQVVVLGSIKLYPKRGTYQLTVWQVLPGGDGLQALRYRQLRSHLAQEGLFDLERKRPLPLFPDCIAVVTSPQAAAWGDIQRTLTSRCPGLNVLLSPAIVQGAQAPGSIARAIDRVARDGRASVLLLGRGGGAVEDLICFDDERVVRAIAASPIPVITGIGHERDEALADLVADVCAHTPTAAAEKIAPALADLQALQVSQLQRLVRATAGHLQTAHTRLQRLRQGLCQRQLDGQVARAWQHHSWRVGRLLQTLQVRLEQEQQQHRRRQDTLAALDPSAVLRRGYALVRRSSGAIVQRSGDLTPGEQIAISLGQGQVAAKVLSIDVDEEARQPSEGLE